MKPDWTKNEYAFLKSQILRGNVVLFAGAGFSLDAKNAHAQSPPLGRNLAKILADAASHPYHDEPLPIVYEAVEPIIGTRSLSALLRSHYDIRSFQSWYGIVKTTTWYRIYTTNIDNLFDKLYYGNKEQLLRSIICPSEYEERDPHFTELQCIHLHGHIDHPQARLTFSLKDFAQQTTRSNPWYQSLVDDINNRPILFVGTLLEEAPFHHYLELRERRDQNFRESRPKSYLVCPNISDLRSSVLHSRNIIPVDATADEFFTSLSDEIAIGARSVPSVRSVMFPHLTIRAKYSLLDAAVNKQFDLISPNTLPLGEPQQVGSFLMGSEPTWNDIKDGVDGDRDINHRLLESASEPSKVFRTIVLHGPAGSGKTTTLMRVAVNLAQKGMRVYFSRSSERTDFESVIRLAKASEQEPSRLVLMVDVMSRHIAQISQVRDQLTECSNLTLILADRTNTYTRRCQALARLGPIEISMPDLTESDAKAILQRLEQYGLLGVLRSKTKDAQIAAFMEVANKQLLVALREATSGQGFDMILRSEFSDLDRQAQLAYLICCLAVAKGAPGVYRRHLYPCLDRSDLSKAELVNSTLKGVIVSANATGTMLKPRHRFIGGWVSKEIADDDLKLIATRLLLIQLSGDITPSEIKRRSPAFLAYRGMINCEGLWETFAGNSKIVLGLYDDLKGWYDGDFLFWLHYGMAHIKAGNLDKAENYLNQSLNLRSVGNFQAKHQLGILYLTQAVAAPQPGSAMEKAVQGIELLTDQITTRGDEDSYPYAAYLTYVSRWYDRARAIIGNPEWSGLRKIQDVALLKYGRDEIVREASKEVDRLYMMRAVKR